MPRSPLLLALSALILTSLACATLMGRPEPEEEFSYATGEPIPESTDPPVELLSCKVLTDQIMEISTAASESESEETVDESTLVIYTVNGDEISDPYYEDVSSDLLDEQEDTATQEQAWNYYTLI